MNFTTAMNRMLPPRGGKTAHITSDYGKRRTIGSSPHVGIDFNYVGGQTGINLTRPPVYAPIGGTVTFTQGNYGTVKIRDVKGYSHEILHLTRIAVGNNQVIQSGQLIGYMSNTGLGPRGAYHVHYQLRTPNGAITDPHPFWADPDAAIGDEPPKEDVDDVGNVEQPGGVVPPPHSSRRLMPQQATEATASGADRALWTNRVPEHEPWPRVLKCQPQKDASGTQQYDDEQGMAYQDADVAERQSLNRHHTNEFSDASAWVGRAEGNELIERNTLWKR